MRKLLIADSSQEICERIYHALHNDFEILCCSDGEDFMDILCSFQPDILALDLCLSGADSLGMLQAAYIAGIRPHTIVMANCFTEYVLQILESINICHLMRQPCAVSAVISRICDVALHLDVSAGMVSELERSIHTTLMSLNFRRTGGYQYVVYALLEICGAGHYGAVMQMYAALGEQYGSTATQVEKAIRDSIRNAWNNRRESVWRLYFPVGRQGSVPCPANSVFLTQVAARLLENGPLPIPKAQ